MIHMELKGKLKEDFEKWLLVDFYKYEKESSIVLIRSFYNSPDSMQWGVIQDFADYVGDMLEVTSRDGGYWVWHPIRESCFGTREEGRAEAVKQFKIWYNGK